MACKVFVGSLPVGTKAKELRHLFQNFGIVIECDVKNRYGFVHMETPAMAETAILALNGSEFNGEVINVEPGRDSNMGQGRPKNMTRDSGDQGVPNFGGGGRGFRLGGGGPFNNSRGGGPPNRGGGPSNRGRGPPNRGGIGGNPFNNNRGGMLNRGGMHNRGGHNEGRGGFNNRSHTEGGPMRNAPSFKQRPGPYPPINGGPQNDDAGPAARGGGKFDSNPRGGFNGPPNRNQNPQQRNNNWGGGPNNVGGTPQQQHGGNFEGMGPMSGGFGGGNMRNPNFGQDRRGFTLDNPQPPMQRQQQFGGGNRRPNDRHNFNALPDEGAAGFGNPNMHDGPPQRGRGGGRGNFGPGRGGRGGGRGGFGGGRGPGGPGNFGPPPENVNTYNQEFPALPTRGRGGLGGGNRGGNRGGFNRNAQNMMSNRRQNI